MTTIGQNADGVHLIKPRAQKRNIIPIVSITNTIQQGHHTEKKLSRQTYQ